jgi:exodeoxyribonuclease VII large subunit
MRVLVRGRVSLFPRDGQYQMYIDDMQPDGVGALHIAFEQCKQKLAAEGLFDESRKKPLPPYPMRIGVITSPTGAALQDILNILSRRFPLAEVVFCPVQVQGDAAAPQICDAIRRMNAQNAADVLIVGRGGGSIEDLWAFNEECVARAVASSHIPVISAVGHETDFTICDFAADLRAPTPSAAAELAVPDESEERALLYGYAMRAYRAVSAGIARERTALRHAAARTAPANVSQLLRPHRLLLDQTADKLENAMQNKMQFARSRLSLQCGKLDALSPLRVLARGYAIAEKDGVPVTDASELSRGDRIDLRLYKGRARCTIDETEATT